MIDRIKMKNNMKSANTVTNLVAQCLDKNLEMYEIAQNIPHHLKQLIKNDYPILTTFNTT